MYVCRLNHFHLLQPSLLKASFLPHPPCRRRFAIYNPINEPPLYEEQAHQAYKRGDGATAKHLSNEGKRHAAEADKLFNEMSVVAFELNNPTPDQVDFIDLHGQTPSTAERLVADRIRRDQNSGKPHLHVYEKSNILFRV